MPAINLPPNVEVVVSTPKTFTLVNVLNVRYDFTVNGDTVSIICTRGKHSDHWCLSVREARVLYRRMLNQGYTKF